MKAHALDLNNPDTASTIGAELATTSTTLAGQLTRPAVTDLASLEQATLDRKDLGAAAKRVEAFFDPVISLAHKLHLQLCARKNEILGPLLRLDAAKREEIRAYYERESRAREQRAREIAEQQRRDDQTRAVAEAAALEQSGEPLMAAAVLAEAIAAPAPIVVLPDPVRAVQSFRRTWRWRYVNDDETRALQLIPRDFLRVDTVKVNRYVTAMKDSGKPIPGIQIYYVDDPIR